MSVSIKITEITYSIGRTVQVAPYSPLNFHASVKAEIGEEDVLKAFGQLKEIVKQQIDNDIETAVNPPIVKKKREPNKFKGIAEQGPGFNLPN